MQLTERKDIRKLVLLFTLTYMVSYITRINYGAIILEIEKSTSIARSILSIALTGSFITYGTGQIISGILGDRFSPKMLVSTGLAVTSVINFCIPLCREPWQMITLWCVNGFAQSLMWPPMVRMMTALLSSDDYKNATATVSIGSMLGTIAVYLASPVIISVASWNGVFVFSAFCGATMCLMWQKFSPDVKTVKSEKSTEKGVSGKVIFSPVMIAIFLAIILQGMLRDGVTTWMPTYISETYDLGSNISILSGVILPLFGAVCIKLAAAVYKNKVKDPVLFAALIFTLSAVFAAALYFTNGRVAALSVLFSALLTGCMHGVNLMLVCMIPAFFKRFGNVSAVSGIINSCTYIGSAASAYGMALVSEKMGWGFTVVTWVAIAALGAVICFACIGAWKKKFE